MNDDFLYRIRIDPPKRFLAMLKASLDRQHEESSGLPRRTQLRKALLWMLLGVAGVATAFIVTEFRRQPSSNPNSPIAHLVPGPVEFGDPAPVAKPKSESIPANAPALDARRPSRLRITGPSIFQLTIQQSARILRNNGVFMEANLAIADSSAAIAALCDTDDTASPAGRNDLASSSPDAVVSTRRILPDELKDCSLRGVTHVVQIKLGYAAVVLARSGLYAAPQLTLRDIFLALARDTPDGRRLAKNSNTSWNQVNSALIDDRIDISGPGVNSTGGISVREILLEPGCQTVFQAAGLKITDDGCGNSRTDGVYHEPPHDLVGYLEANPEALALIDYQFFAMHRAQLVAASIDGTEATDASLKDGSYRGSRTLYLYVNGGRARASALLRGTMRALLDSVGSPDSTLVMLDESDQRASQKAISMLPDVTL
jgi:ABC-type phosphate transport system substrate-binding protein